MYVVIRSFRDRLQRTADTAVHQVGSRPRRLRHDSGATRLSAI